MIYSAKIDTSWEPEELNAFLGNKLLDYAKSLALVLMEAFWGYPYFGMKKSSIDSELKHIDKTREELMNRLRYHADEYQIFERYEDMKNKKEKDDYIISEFGLGSFFRTLNVREKWLKQYLNSPSANIEGQPIKKKYKIALIWILKIRKQFGASYEIPWANVIRLLKWFYERLKNTSYGSDLWTRKDIRKASKSFKERCFPIISNPDNWALIEREGIFIPGYRSTPYRLIPYSIDFNKKGIAIAEKFNKHLGMHIVEFREKKKYYLMNVSKLPPRKKMPFIIFPNRDTLYPPD